jgi:xylose isomerase
MESPMNRNKYSVILGNLGNTCDRFLSSGYKDQPSKAKMVKTAAAIPGIKGLELVGTWDVTPANAREMKHLLEDHGLACVAIIPDHFAQKVWGTGSFCSRDPAVRQKALDDTLQMADIARSMGGNLLNLWLGQDGYDYPLQADFGRERAWMVEGIGQAAERAPDIRFALEYKMKEPRNYSYQARAADTLLMVREIGRDNVGVCIDVGHALLARENAAESVWMLQHYGRRLFHLHFNDNYRYWDDDMIVGSVHFAEYVELLFWLRQTGYDGWYSMDLYPYREDGARAVAESVAFLRDLEDALTGERMDELRGLIATGDATASTRWIREFIFHRG